MFIACYYKQNLEQWIFDWIELVQGGLLRVFRTGKVEKTKTQTLAFLHPQMEYCINFLSLFAIIGLVWSECGVCAIPIPIPVGLLWFRVKSMPQIKGR